MGHFPHAKAFVTIFLTNRANFVICSYVFEHFVGTLERKKTKEKGGIPHNALIALGERPLVVQA